MSTSRSRALELALVVQPAVQPPRAASAFQNRGAERETRQLPKRHRFAKKKGNRTNKNSTADPVRFQPQLTCPLLASFLWVVLPVGLSACCCPNSKQKTTAKARYSRILEGDKVSRHKRLHVNIKQICGPLSASRVPPKPGLPKHRPTGF